MISRYIKLTIVYGLILASGLAIGWGAPRLYERLKPAYSEGDYSAYYAGTPSNVVLYGTPTCPYCAKVRSYLTEHKIQFTDFDITSDAKAKRDFAALGSRTVPVTLIGRRRIDGYTVPAISDALEVAGHNISR